MSIAKKILIDELENQTHPEKVEDVIFWALEAYAKSELRATWGEIIAYAISKRIKSAESEREIKAPASTPSDADHNGVQSKWRETNIELPMPGVPVLVEHKGGNVYYAVYSGENEFDLHMPTSSNYRSKFFKFSKRLIVRWRYLPDLTHQNP